MIYVDKIKEKGIKLEDKDIFYNSDIGTLVTNSVINAEGKLSRKGTLVIKTRCDDRYGERHTSRAPDDRFIVDHPPSTYTKDPVTHVHDNVAWDGHNQSPAINQPISPENAKKLEDEVINYLNSQNKLYIQENLAGANRKYTYPVITVTESPTYALFIKNALRDFPTGDLSDIANNPIILTFAPGYKIKGEPQDYGLRSDMFANLDFLNKTINSGGEKYCGEAKKAIFTLLNYLMPFQGVFPMHCGANKGEDGDVALFFGLSGTGKTSLSADPNRKLIGDDEHGWCPEGIFNFEGGCYAKLIELNSMKERDIWNAIRKFGAIAENVVLRPDGSMDLDDRSLTENTRGSYPIKYIENVSFTGMGDHPKYIFFLTCDSTGVIPPISRLSPEQAMYHFLSGYTSKIAGTEKEKGEVIKEPKQTFSSCFGLPFMPLSPVVYAELLGNYMNKYGSKAFLVNTGWAEGPFGVGRRINIEFSRYMISAAIKGGLDHAPTEMHEDLRLEMITTCGDIPKEILRPWKSWDNVADYRIASRKLSQAFSENFKRKHSDAPNEIADVGPKNLDHVIEIRGS